MNITLISRHRNGSDGRAFAKHVAVMKLGYSSASPRRKAVWGPNGALVAAVLAIFAYGSDALAAGHHGSNARHVSAGTPNSNVKNYKLDGELNKRANRTAGSLSKTRVIVELAPGASVPPAFQKYARRNGNLNIINGAVLDVPNYLLKSLASQPGSLRVHFDRPAKKDNYRTAMTIGSRAVSRSLGFTGAGVGVAVIDSGVVSWHDDLTNRTNQT